MKKQSVVWFLAGILVGSIAVAIWKERSIADLRSALEETLRTNERLKSERASSKPEIRASQPLAALPARQPTSATLLASSRSRRVIDSNQAAVTYVYGKTLGRLNLSEEQRAFVESLLAKRLAALQEIQAQHLGTTETNKFIAAFETEFAQGISDAVGSTTGDKISKMLRYEGSLQHADSLENLSPQDPYSVDQRLEMARIFSEATQRNPTNNALSPDDIDAATGLAEYDKKILAEASGVLSPKQLDGLAKRLGEMRVRSVATYQAQQAIKKAIFEKAGRR